MDSYNNSYTSNSETSSSSSFRSNNQFRSALHSVRNKVPFKNIITKKPIAPMPPIPPKVYKVDPIDFRDVVQKLTGAPEYMPPRLRDVAPPPLSLSPLNRPPVFYSTMMTHAVADEYMTVAQQEVPCKSSDHNTFGTLSPLGFNLSPATLAWCSAIMLSPASLSAFEPSAVL